MRKSSPKARMTVSMRMAMIPQSGMLHLLLRNLSFGLDSRPTNLKVSR